MCAAYSEAEFGALLDYIKRNRGFDFTGYKRSTLYRRIQKRMQTVHIASFAEYVDYLEVHPDEFVYLFNTVLINVTGFFRDGPSWDYLRREVLPRMLERKGKSDPVRAWSAGCASGEEAYSLAMMLAEGMGLDAFQRRVKIYATDVDEEALAQARHGSYEEKTVEPVPAALREKYFEQAGSRFVIHGDLRRAVVFGRHDLLQDAPISRIDLLTCRNTLMYFNAEAQGRIFARLHYALNDAGFLFLGRAEMLLLHAHLFTPVEMRFRVFAKAPQSILREGLPIFPIEEAVVAANPEVQQFRLQDEAFAAAPLALLVVDQEGRLALATTQARALLGLAPQDLGRAFQDLDISYRPLELRSLIQRATVERRPVTIPDVERSGPGGEVQYFEVQVMPLQDAKGQIVGTSIGFMDMTRVQRLRVEMQRVAQDRETAYEELQSANEELETTNEELQSTVEELQTTNEELQSANEEMETMNEELQSTNEELRTANKEAQRHADELARLNEFLDSILASVRLGVVVVDQNLQIRSWNDRAEDMWGLRAEEVLGQPLRDLNIGLPVADLQGAVHAFLTGEGKPRETVMDAINRRGKTIKCRIACTLRLGPQRERRGVVLLMEEIEQ